MRTLTYKGMIGKYEVHTDNDGKNKYYAGSLPGITEAVVLFEGETIEELEQDFRDAVDDCIAHEYKQKKRMSHRIAIPRELYLTLKERASLAGISVSAYARKALASAVL